MKEAEVRMTARLLAALAGVGAVVLLAWGCDSTTGMYCQKDGDCRSGLICAKAPSSALDGGRNLPNGIDGAEVFGVCEPARRGVGETCLWTSECQGPLFCSNEVGQFLDDQRHGTCQPRHMSDMPGAHDLGMMLQDLGPDQGQGDDAAPHNDGGD